MSAPLSKLLIFACARSNLSKATLPVGAQLVELPCTGRLSLPLLLGALVRGWHGVLVLGRHQSTCRLGGAEDSARDRLERGAILAGLAGLHSERMAFVEPAPGPAGPLEAVQAFHSSLAAFGENPLEGLGALAPEPAGNESLDTALKLFSLIASTTAFTDETAAVQREAAFDRFLAAHALPKATPGQPVLLAGALPQLALVGGSLFRPHDLAGVLGAALGTLARLGVGAGLAYAEDAATGGPVFALEPTVVEAQVVDALLAERGGELPCPEECATIAYDGSPAKKAVIEALGHRALSVGAHPLPKRFALTAEERGAAAAYLAKAEAQGARGLFVSDALSLCKWAMLTRSGSWRGGRILPVTGAQLAQLSLAKLPLRGRTLATPLPRSYEVAP